MPPSLPRITSMHQFPLGSASRDSIILAPVIKSASSASRTSEILASVAKSPSTMLPLSTDAESCATLVGGGRVGENPGGSFTTCAISWPNVVLLFVFQR
ncbi:hypothetical protein BD779DRAFT_283669 [Infundibulicybe gibba]|nr:hypothetical protein BD779DRAFT_283669 [Infundibulicybe gibba]